MSMNLHGNADFLTWLCLQYTVLDVCYANDDDFFSSDLNAMNKLVYT